MLASSHHGYLVHGHVLRLQLVPYPIHGKMYSQAEAV
jgi:hypothetical protein